MMKDEINDLVMKFLIEEKGFDVNAKNYYNSTMLHNIGNNFDIMKLLIKYGSDVNAQNKSNQTPLQLAANRKNICMCKYLIENGADILKGDVLHSAGYNSQYIEDDDKKNHKELVEYLTKQFCIQYLEQKNEHN